MSNFDKYLHLLLDYFSILFSERLLHNVYVIADNFRIGYVQASGSPVVMCSFLVPLLNIVCLFTHVYFLTELQALKN